MSYSYLNASGLDPSKYFFSLEKRWFLASYKIVIEDTKTDILKTYKYFFYFTKD